LTDHAAFQSLGVIIWISYLVWGQFEVSTSQPSFAPSATVVKRWTKTILAGSFLRSWGVKRRCP